MSDEIKGKRVWVTRNEQTSDYWVWTQCPAWVSFSDVGGGSWRSLKNGDPYLTSICPKLFTKWLGAKPTAKLAKGGPKAIEKATLYVALDWGHDESY